MTSRSSVVVAAALLAAVGCSSVYYSAWEALGKEKRDLLRRNILDVRDEQEATVEEFESALDRLRQLYKVDADDLEKVYDKLKADHEDAAERAAELGERIDETEDVAADLFAEWKDELDDISNRELRDKSRQKMVETERSYAELATSLRRAEKNTAPVLQQLNDHVLYIKHNLNAAAVGGLKAEMSSIEDDIEDLVDDMKSSIAEADRFLKTLPE